MGATTVTGKGTGDSGKRLAYLSSDLPSLQIIETTTNKQDLITTTVSGGGGGCDCNFNTQWEIVFSVIHSVTDVFNQPTGIAHDPLYEWAFGVISIEDSPLIITDEILKSVRILHGGQNGEFNNGIRWSPDNTNFFTFQNKSFSALHFGALMPDDEILTMIANNISEILYDGPGFLGPANNFTYSSVCNIESALTVYTIICRRPLTA